MSLVAPLGLWRSFGAGGARVSGLRILALVTDAFGGNGGIARYNQDLMSAFATSARVREICVLPRQGSLGHQALPQKVLQARASAARLAFSTQAIARAALDGPFDIVFCGHIYMSPIAAAISKFLKKPMWLQLHGIDAWQPRGGRLARTATESAALVTAVSRFTRSRFLRWADIAPERVRVLPNTFEPSFTAGPKPEYLLDRLNIHGRRVILTVSRLTASEQYKGHDRIIAALPAIKERIADVVYVIAGDGDDRERLKKMAKAAGVEDITLFAGHVPERELPGYLRLADVFAMPSTGEGFGIVYLEAAACGLPVIAGDRDGSVDALADGAIGTLIDPEDAPQLVDAVCNMLAGRGRQAQPTSHDRFRAGNFNTHVDNLLENFL
ncbi:Glycosyltransferase involved in cell wall bisynthesis [Hyphomicrobium facile]|uniref:Glycosyltransferase involved in cell wall bisynthesis n=1 Tax=Hyphomicrobium facile TaxID=51670 RepID=A0A1I7NDH8_9HYPH|nr:Glycosyltransferase involved in cell wall bisynthesis [Hyphomicrobium facile]